MRGELHLKSTVMPGLKPDLTAPNGEDHTLQPTLPSERGGGAPGRAPERCDGHREYLTTRLGEGR